MRIILQTEPTSTATARIRIVLHNFSSSNEKIDQASTLQGLTQMPNKHLPVVMRQSYQTGIPSSGARRERTGNKSSKDGPPRPANPAMAARIISHLKDGSSDDEEDAEAEMENLLATRAGKSDVKKGPQPLPDHLRRKVLKYGQEMSFASTELTRDMALRINLSLKQREDVRTAIKRHEWYLFEEKFDFRNPLHRQMMLQFNGIKTATFRSYYSHWNQLRKKGYSLTMPDIHRFLTNHHMDMAALSGQTWISAVKCYLTIRMGVVSSRLEDQRSKFLLRGAVLSQVLRTHNKPTGSLERKQLIELINTDLPKHIGDGLVIEIASGLRCMRVSSVRHNEVRVVYDSRQELVCFCICLPRDKVSGLRADNRFVYHYTDPYWNEYILLLLQEATAEYEATPIAKRDPRGAVLVPGWSGSGHNTIINKYAQALGWDENLNWTTHSGKYGAAVEAGKRAACQGRSAQEVVDIIKATTGHLSTWMVSKYSEGHAMKKRRGEHRAWLAQWVKGKPDQTMPALDYLEHELKVKLKVKARAMNQS